MGCVYILTNPSFREDWIKIGKTKNPVNLRSKELDNTSIPLPFEVYASIDKKQADKFGSSYLGSQFNAGRYIFLSE